MSMFYRLVQALARISSSPRISSWSAGCEISTTRGDTNHTVSLMMSIWKLCVEISKADCLQTGQSILPETTKLKFTSNSRDTRYKLPKKPNLQPPIQQQQTNIQRGGSSRHNIMDWRWSPSGANLCFGTIGGVHGQNYSIPTSSGDQQRYTKQMISLDSSFCCFSSRWPLAVSDLSLFSSCRIFRPLFC